MSNFPDLSHHGYQILAELGRNREGGRITWKATQLKTGDVIVLKQFCFAIAGSNWSGFNAYEREIQVLQALDYPKIPRYLDSFETSDGFCLVQEYKQAPSLAENRSFTPAAIKTIAIEILEILVYLQSRTPPIIHRDIKPENILVDDNLTVYLVDFGFASISSQESLGSSVFKGTPGFIPPEQVRKPTEASDLYSLGVTLICLLTRTRSPEVLKLTAEDDPYTFEFKHLLPPLNPRFVDWLAKMVQPKLKDRYANAAEALAALNLLEVMRDLAVQSSENQSAVVPIEFQNLPYGLLLLLLILSIFSVLGGTQIWNVSNGWGMLGAGIGAISGFALGSLLKTEAGDLDTQMWTAIWAIAGAIIFTGPVFWVGTIVGAISVIEVVAGCVAGFIARVVAFGVLSAGEAIGLSPIIRATYLLLTIGLGTILGVGLIVGFLNSYILWGLTGTSLSLAIMLLYPALKRARQLAKALEAKKQKHVIES
jgi:hypothetical protein